MYRIQCPRGNLLCTDESLGFSVTVAVTLSAVALSLQALEQGKGLLVVIMTTGLCWHLGSGEQEG